MITTTFLIIAIIRTVLVVAVVYHFCKYFNAHKPTNKFLLKHWKKDKRLRDLLIQYWWQFGVGFFLVQIVIKGALNIS